MPSDRTNSDAPALDDQGDLEKLDAPAGAAERAHGPDAVTGDAVVGAFGQPLMASMLRAYRVRQWFAAFGERWQ